MPNDIMGLHILLSDFDPLINLLMPSKDRMAPQGDKGGKGPLYYFQKMEKSEDLGEFHM